MEGIIATPEFQVSLLLFAALGGYLLASRINQSAVVGIILVGLLIGPSVLGLVSYNEFVRGLAHLGAVVLLFVIGFEFKLRDILKPSYALIALVGVIIPWVGGYATAIWAGMDFASGLFIGTALTATSIAITANVLQELDKLQTGPARAIIGAAVIDDVLSLVALAITGDVVAGAFSPAVIFFILLKVAIFLVVAGAVGIFIVSRFLVRLDQTSFVAKYPEFIFIFAMMFAFLYAMIAELVGLSAIVGAFIAGISFERLSLRKSLDVKEGAEFLKIIFAAIFFVSLGVVADIKAITPEIVPFLVVLTVVAIVTKVVGCALPARAAGMCTKDSLIIGFGMAPRGEVAMIVALIGLEQEYIGQEVFVIIILMSLITTLITPIVYRNWFYKEEYCKPEIEI
ncbi:MAG TPA: cation:proton antiporter [Methanolinea sp.]|jgi:Kef-type K+ transport system membrane component KefB|nr:MAG: putative cation:proton antiport protein [Methanoregulaceae archaeon PtaU1.Bin066]HII76539.1 cation:proton antiporter [Methanolinea sp.]HNQ30056.1 cation:proton antiporter [Methanolinea sp.]